MKIAFLTKYTASEAHKTNTFRVFYLLLGSATIDNLMKLRLILFICLLSQTAFAQCDDWEIIFRDNAQAVSFRTEVRSDSTYGLWLTWNFINKMQGEVQTVKEGLLKLDRHDLKAYEGNLNFSQRAGMSSQGWFAVGKYTLTRKDIEALLELPLITIEMHVMLNGEPGELIEELDEDGSRALKKCFSLL